MDLTMTGRGMRPSALSVSLVPAPEGAGVGPTEEELAAAMVAVASYLAAEQEARAGEQLAAVSGWQASKVLISQGLGPARARTRPTWSNLERLRLGSRGFVGIVGV